MRVSISRLFALAALLCCCTAVDAVETVLLPKAVAVAGQSEASFSLLAMNPGAESVDFTPPAEIKAVLHSGSVLSAELVLRLQGSSQAAKVAPNGFARFEYSVRIPVAVIGPVVLDAPSAGLKPVMFSVQGSEMAKAASQPASTAPGDKAEQIRRETALRRSTRLLSGVSAYDPVYFGMGLRDGMNAKFQVSLKYNPFDQWPLYMGYTQTSLWDLHSTSKPFRDTAYRPAVFLQDNSLLVSSDGKLRFGGLAGLEHESNGKGGDDSRSINIAVLRPRLEWTLRDDLKFVLSPKFYGYIEKSENPDIADYRGYTDLYLGMVYRDYRLSTTLRKGVKGHYGSVQVDAVFPLRASDDFLSRIGVQGMNGYWFIQYFSGWGESILDYKRKLPSQVRTGLMIVP